MHKETNNEKQFRRALGGSLVLGKPTKALVKLVAYTPLRMWESVVESLLGFVRFILTGAMESGARLKHRYMMHRTLRQLKNKRPRAKLRNHPSHHRAETSPWHATEAMLMTVILTGLLILDPENKGFLGSLGFPKFMQLGLIVGHHFCVAHFDQPQPLRSNKLLSLQLMVLFIFLLVGPHLPAAAALPITASIILIYWAVQMIDVEEDERLVANIDISDLEQLWSELEKSEPDHDPSPKVSVPKPARQMTPSTLGVLCVACLIFLPLVSAQETSIPTPPGVKTTLLPRVKTTVPRDPTKTPRPTPKKQKTTAAPVYKTTPVQDLPVEILSERHPLMPRLFMAAVWKDASGQVQRAASTAFLTPTDVENGLWKAKFMQDDLSYLNMTGKSGAIPVDDVDCHLTWNYVGDWDCPLVSQPCPTIRFDENPYDVRCYCKDLEIEQDKDWRILYPSCPGEFIGMTEERSRNKRMAVPDHGTLLIDGFGHMPVTGDNLPLDMDKMLSRMEYFLTKNFLHITIAISAVFYYTGSKRLAVATFALALLLSQGGMAMEYGNVNAALENCHEAEDRDFLTGDRSTWVDMDFVEGKCYTIRTPGGPKIDMELTASIVADPVRIRTWLPALELGGLNIQTRCPVTGEAACHQWGTNYTTLKTYSQRGWGNGCGTFGRGSFCASQQISAADGVRQWHEFEVDTDKINHHIKFMAGPSQTVQSAIINTRSYEGEASFGLSGKLKYKCTPRSTTALDNHNILYQVPSSGGCNPRIIVVPGDTHNSMISTYKHECSETNAWVVRRSWTSSLHLPYVPPPFDASNRIQQPETMVFFEEPHATSIVSDVREDATSRIKESLRQAPSVKTIYEAYDPDYNTPQFRLPKGKISCSLRFNDMKLRGSTYAKCPGAYTMETNPALSPSKTWLFKLSGFASAPCRLNVGLYRDKECTKESGKPIDPDLYAQTSTQVVMVELTSEPGDAYICYGYSNHGDFTNKLLVNRGGSRTMDFLDATKISKLHIAGTGETGFQLRGLEDVFNALKDGAGQTVNMIKSAIFGDSDLAVLVAGGLFVLAGLTAISNGHAAIGAITTVIGLALLGPTMGWFSVHAGLGCGIDASGVSCGSGIFVWRWNNKWRFRESLYVKDHRQIASWILTLDPTVCIACHDPLECELWDGLASEARMISRAKGKVFDVEYFDSSVTDFLDPTYTFLLRDRRSVAPTKVRDNDNYQYLVEPLFFHKDYTEENLGKRIIVSHNHTNATCETMVHADVVPVGFDTGFRGTRLQVELKPAMGHEECRDYIMASAAKFKEIIHSSDRLWMISRSNGSYALTALYVSYSTVCQYPREYTVAWQQSPRTFAPAQLGFPQSAGNVLPGYGSQYRFPWNKAPVEMLRGPCPDTRVEYHKGTTTGPACRSTDRSGHPVKKWQCGGDGCENNVYCFKVGPDYYYPMEIRPSTTRPFCTSFDARNYSLNTTRSCHQRFLGSLGNSI